MAFTFRIVDVPNLTAASDLSAKQYYAVKRTAANAISLAGQTAYVGYVGILQDKPSAAGMSAWVAGIGSLCKIIADGTFAVGDLLIMHDTAGTFKKATDGDVCFARAESAGSSGLVAVATILQPAAIADVSLWGVANA